MICRLMGVRIKELRNDLGMSQEAFAHHIDMARTYFAEVEVGKRNISMRNLLKITNGLGVTLEQFFDSPLFDEVSDPEGPVIQRWTTIRSGRTSTVIVVRATQELTNIPLLGAIAAGSPDEPLAGNSVYPVPKEFRREHPGAFLLRVSGESMNRVLPDGCYALVEPCASADEANGIYAVSVGGTAATVKRVRKHPRSLVLAPDSDDPAFKPITYDAASIGEVSVVGRVVGFTVPAQ